VRVGLEISAVLFGDDVVAKMTIGEPAGATPRGLLDCDVSHRLYGYREMETTNIRFSTPAISFLHR
jgi:hypothetical protein